MLIIRWAEEIFKLIQVCSITGVLNGDLLLIYNKYKLIHFEYNNHKYQYSLGTEMLNVSCREKILGVLTDD